MIIVPSSLFILNESDHYFGRILPKEDNNNEEQKVSESKCYCLNGKLCFDTLILWRENSIGKKFFLVLEENEIQILEYDHQNVFGDLIKNLNALEIEKLGQTIGISRKSGEFSRHIGDRRKYMTQQDGRFFVTRSNVMKIDLLLNEISFSFVLNEIETTALYKLNQSSIILDSNNHENFFVRSALRLLNDKQIKEMNETEVYRKLYLRTFPANNELIMFGHLKKRNKNLGWKERFVALAPGKMFYVEKTSNSSTSSSINNNTINSNSGSSITPQQSSSSNNNNNAATPKVIKLTSGKTWCRAPLETSTSGTPSALWNQTKFDSDRIFEILIVEDEPISTLLSSGSISSSSSTTVTTATSTSNYNNATRLNSELNVTKYAWACESKEDRDRWIHFIQSACSLSDSVAATLASNEFCTHIRNRMQKVENTSDHLLFLQELNSKEIKVGVDWIQTQFGRPRGELDATMEQAIKDTERDCVLVNGQSCVPCNATTVMGAIARQISLIVPEINEDCILSFSKLVLLATNRTQSGGLMWEATNLILNVKQGAVLIPNNPDKILPIEIFIEKPNNNNLSTQFVLGSGVDEIPSISTTSTTMISSTPSSPFPTTDTNKSPTGASSNNNSSIKRRFHRRTASDPQFFLKLIGAAAAAAAVATGSSPSSQMLPSAPSSEFLKINPTSPKNSLIRSLSLRKKTVESESLLPNMTYEEHIKVKVHVRAQMEFYLMDEQSLGSSNSTNSDTKITPKLALVTTTFTRDFCMVEGRSFALDQGIILLNISNVARGVPTISAVEVGNEEAKQITNDKEEQDKEEQIGIENFSLINKHDDEHEYVEL